MAGDVLKELLFLAQVVAQHLRTQLRLLQIMFMVPMTDVLSPVVIFTQVLYIQILQTNIFLPIIVPQK